MNTTLLVLVCILSITASALSSSRGLFAEVCFADAPEVTECINGVNQNGPFGKLGIQDICVVGCMTHSVDGVPGYIGIVESHLIWEGGERVFSCKFTDPTGEITASCTGYGIFPPQYAVFYQVCKSLDVNTKLSGGNGIFGCHVIHY